MTLAADADRLARTIGKLTGRKPTTRNIEYLTRRLADLKARIERGEDVRHVDNDAVPVSVSLPADARTALRSIARADGTSVSAVVVEALRALAAKHAKSPSWRSLEQSLAETE